MDSLITANEMQMRTPIFGQIRAQMVVRIDCAHVMRMQKSGCINAAENRTSGTNRYVHVLYECTYTVPYRTHVGTTYYVLYQYLLPGYAVHVLNPISPDFRYHPVT